MVRSTVQAARSGGQSESLGQGTAHGHRSQRGQRRQRHRHRHSAPRSARFSMRPPAPSSSNLGAGRGRCKVASVPVARANGRPGDATCPRHVWAGELASLPLALRALPFPTSLPQASKSRRSRRRLLGTSCQGSKPAWLVVKSAPDNESANTCAALDRNARTCESKREECRNEGTCGVML